MPSGKTFGTLAPIASTLAAWAYAWLLPRTAARRVQHLPLTIAFGLHLLALLISSVTIFLAIAWADADFATVNDALANAVKLWQEILRDSQDIPGGFITIALFVAAGVEVFHLLVAVILSPWGARDEPVRDSLRSSVRQAWLHTAHFAVVAVVITVAAFGLHYAATKFAAIAPPPESNLIAPTWPALQKTDPGYDAAHAEYQAALREHQRAYLEWQLKWDAWNARRPWYIRWDETTIALLIFHCLFWIFWSLLRAIGTDRDVPTVSRPPNCLACGYNLTATPLDARCPECGRAVSDSLGGTAQPGVPWEHRSTRGRIATYAQTALTAIFRPSSAGLMMRLTSDSSHHRRYFWPHIPFVWTIAASAVLTAMYFGGGGADQFVRDPTPMLIGASCFALVCCMGFILFACLSALVIGLLQTWRTRRNLLPASMRAACYLAPALIAWELLGAMVVLIAAMLVEAGLLENFEQRTGIFWEHALLAFVFVPNVVSALTFIYLVNLITSAARHANR